MTNGNNEECADANETPHPIREELECPASSDVPANDSVPLAPSSDEPVSGHLVEPEQDEDEEKPFRRKPGPKPMVEQHRMKEVLQFIEGRIPGGELGRLRFLQLTGFTAREKSYLVNHACFKELYDAKIFDYFMTLEIPTKEDLKLLELVGKRVGLSKPATQVNVQVNNNNASEKEKKKNRNVRIEVGE